MLKSLYVRNYALIDELEMEYGAGLNILTGETGAGKSLLLGALGLILGKRADFSYIFNPDQKCIVEALFSNPPERIKNRLEAFEEFDWEGDDSMRIRREVSSSGKSRAFVNDTPVSLTVLKEVSGLLVDFHGQHENQKLLTPEHQVRLLDDYAGSDDLVKEFAGLLKQHGEIGKSIATLQEAERIARQQLDYYKFQFEELENAELSASEERGMEEEMGLLQNAELIKETLAASTEQLYHGENALYNQLSELLPSLEKIADYSPILRESLDKLNDAAYAMQDVAFELTRLEETTDLDPERLEELESRYDLYNRLKLKFSVGSAEELIALKDGFEEKLIASDSMEKEIGKLQSKQEKIRMDLGKLGLMIEKARTKALPKLAKKVNSLLKQVGLENASFEVEITPLSAPEGWVEMGDHKVNPTSHGPHKIEFLISTNKGLPKAPLAKTASGGEISRVMLAIKSALADQASLSVLIFDEIDSGISGEIARKVGQVMLDLSGKYQVIAITHLPQIAGMGKTHFHIYKETMDSKTLSRMRTLEGESRIMELAQMISGSDPSPSAIENARELIAAGGEAGKGKS